MTKKRPEFFLHDATGLYYRTAYTKRSAAVGTNKREELKNMGFNLTTRASISQEMRMQFITRGECTCTQAGILDSTERMTMVLSYISMPCMAWHLASYACTAILPSPCSLTTCSVGMHC